MSQDLKEKIIRLFQFDEELKELIIDFFSEYVSGKIDEDKARTLRWWIEREPEIRVSPEVRREFRDWLVISIYEARGGLCPKLAKLWPTIAFIAFVAGVALEWAIRVLHPFLGV